MLQEKKVIMRATAIDDEVDYSQPECDDLNLDELDDLLVMLIDDVLANVDVMPYDIEVDEVDDEVVVLDEIDVNEL